jgi:hypothetical protein
MESTVPVTIAATILFTALPTAAALYLWFAQAKRKKG